MNFEKVEASFKERKAEKFCYSIILSLWDGFDILNIMNKKERLAYLRKIDTELDQVWQDIKKKKKCKKELKPLLDKALILHQALPEEGFASQRALQRLALYQAKSRAFGMVTFLQNIWTAFGCGAIETRIVSGNLVRDIGLPEFSRGAIR